jgi:hypothetical protein
MKVFSYLAILSLIAFFSSCESRNKLDCLRFKTGKFLLRSEFDGSSTIIERNDSIQVENNLTSGEITKAKIYWVQPCEYYLEYLNKSSGSGFIDSFVRTGPLKTRILKSSKEYYLFESRMDGVSERLVDTLTFVDR